MIPISLLEKYNMVSMEQYKEWFGDTPSIEKDFYQDFLIQTDHIPNKIIEAQALNTKTEDYTEILECRQFARDEINRLRPLVKEEE